MFKVICLPAGRQGIPIIIILGLHEYGLDGYFIKIIQLYFLYYLKVLSW
jgi:hypothetical protein